MSAITNFSQFLGYASMGCWLFAQLPQVLENIQRQSSEGLALPFLANWLAGDISNLLGCILTHQLPFQTWLSIYFCFVDLSLLSQFFYYRNGPLDSSPNRARAQSTSSHRISPERPHRYRTLSAAAANVANTAALAAHQEGGHDSQRHRTRWNRDSTDGLGDRSTSRVSGFEEEETDEPSYLADSFHSEGSGRGSRRKLVSWNSERYGRSGSVGRSQTGPHSSLQITSPSQNADEIVRGRSREREGDEAENEAPEGWTRSRTTSTHRASSRASRRGAGMVFLGVWALFGVGTLVGSKTGSTMGVANIGKVLTNKPFPTPSVPVSSSPIFDQVMAAANSEPVHVVSNDSNASTAESSNSRIIGRIFAWASATLYMTSRLPQIWKNYYRKSVEGLSMYLFIFAFLGNFTYVSSILTSPPMRLSPPEKAAFLRESIPYILGSAGTLMSDVTIVCQSFIYPSPKPRRTSTRGMDEEEAGLLDEDATEPTASR